MNRVFFCPTLKVKFLNKDICSTRHERGDIQCKCCDGLILKEVDDVVIRTKNSPTFKHKKPDFLTRPYDEVHEKITTADLIQQLLDNDPDKLWSPTDIARTIKKSTACVTASINVHLNKRWRRVKRGRYQSLKVQAKQVSVTKLQSKEVVERPSPVSLTSVLTQAPEQDGILRDISDLLRLCEVVDELQHEIDEKFDKIMKDPSAKSMFDCFANREVQLK